MILSYILPYYKRLSAFSEALAHNLAFADPECEVVLVLDEPSEQEQVLKLVAGTTVKLRVVVNDNDHPWRPPCKALNVGLRHARAPRVAILSPETHIDLPYPAFLIRHFFGCGKFYVSGVMHYGRRRGEPFRANHPSGFGMLMIARGALEVIGAFDEAWDHYGGEDDDIRRRLVQAGYRKVVSESIQLSHYETFDSAGHGGHVPRTTDHDRGGDPVVKNPNGWGRDFSRVVYDYENSNTHAA